MADKQGNMVIQRNSCLYSILSGRRLRRLIPFCAIVIISLLLISSYESCTPRYYKKIVKAPTDSITCHIQREVERGPTFRNHNFPKPACQDIRQNITKGKWKEIFSSNLQSDKLKLDELYAEFRSYHEGFAKYPFREDGICGYKSNPNRFCAHFRADASTWCNPKSSKPCCSDSMLGKCVSEAECTAPKSVNLANYVHAELSAWIPQDISCKTVSYTQETACALLHEKQVRSIGFIGNSLMRNAYSVMLQFLTNNFYNGSIVACIPTSLRKKCVNHLQNMDKFCLHTALAPTSRVLPGLGLCNGYLDTLIYSKSYWLAQDGHELKKHVLELLDRPGTYLLVGIGVHDQFNSARITKSYLKPSFDVLAGHTWPKFLWIHQLKSGIFKSPSFVKYHGTDEDIDKFVENLEQFCKSHNIPTLDLREVTSNVWSVDGTHYGTGVNLMKIQIFLNILASNQVF